MNMQDTFILLLLLGAVSEREALHLIHLPATSNVAENSPPETAVYKFAVNLSASLSPVSPGFPLIINSSPLTEAFKVNGLSGTNFEVVTTGKEQLDFEKGPNIFDLQIYVKDQVGTTDLQILTVQVTNVNEPPQFPGNLAKGLELYVTEGTKPGLIYQVEAFDPEDTSQNITLHYFLLSPSKSFRLSPEGSLFSTKEFDFEAGNNSHYLTVEVRDSQGLNVSTTLQVNIVNINDEIPCFLSPYHVLPTQRHLVGIHQLLHGRKSGVSGVNSRVIYCLWKPAGGSTQEYTILEELSPGTIVANITAKDPDDQGFTSHLLYSLTTVNSYFMINRLTGSIQVANRLDRDAGQLRQHPAISLEVLVKDRPQGGQENRIQIKFIVEDINDNPATCTKFTFSIMVSERAAKGTLLLDLNKFCFDDDSEAPNNKFNFTTPSGVGSSSRFLQDPAGSGKIVLNGDLDYENPSNLASDNKYSMIIQVQDVTLPYYKNNIYIYILTIPENEFPLVFDLPSYVFNVSEVSPARTRIGQVQATDKDFPQSTIVYSIVAGGASLQLPNIFWINPRTGELLLMTKADYETTSTYTLRIQATNSEDTSIVTVTVKILEENDEKPLCTPKSSSLAIPVDLKVGINIHNFKLTCTDLDSSPRSFRYSIGPGNINNHFTFSPNAGSNVSRLLLASRFDYTGGLDKIWDYKLLVYITDDNLLSGRKKATARVETGTVTLSIKVIPHPTTIITTTPRPRITYLIQKKNVYSPSAWYVPFVITLGTMLLLCFLVPLVILLVKAIYRHCPFRKKEDKKPLVKKGETKTAKRATVVETIQMNTVFDGEATDPVTGKIYEFNSKTGARRWKNSSTQMPKWKESNLQGSTPYSVNAGEGTGPLKTISKKGDGPSDKGQAEDADMGSRNEDSKPGTPKSKNPTTMSVAASKSHPGK